MSVGFPQGGRWRWTVFHRIWKKKLTVTTGSFQLFHSQAVSKEHFSTEAHLCLIIRLQVLIIRWVLMMHSPAAQRHGKPSFHIMFALDPQNLCPSFLLPSSLPSMEVVFCQFYEAELWTVSGHGCFGHGGDRQLAQSPSFWSNTTSLSFLLVRWDNYKSTTTPFKMGGIMPGNKSLPVQTMLKDRRWNLGGVPGEVWMLTVGC